MGREGESWELVIIGWVWDGFERWGKGKGWRRREWEGEGRELRGDGRGEGRKGR